MSTSTLSYRDALREALREELERDERVILLGEDIGSFGGAFGVTATLAEQFGATRVRDISGSEQALTGAAIGAALTGLRPVLELMTADLLPLALAPILGGAAGLPAASGGRLRVPLVVRMAQQAGGTLGPAYAHAVEALAMHLPGLLVATPATAADAKGLLKAAIRDDNPVVFIEHQALYDERGEVPDDPDEYPPLGAAAVRREGRDVTLAGSSRMAHACIQAADILEREHGISAAVVDLRTLRPLDLGTLTESVRRTNRLVVAEEGWPQAGVAATLAALVTEQAFDHLDAPVLRVSGADTPVPYAPALVGAAVPDARSIATAALASLGG